MQFFDARATNALLPYPALAEAIRAVLRDTQAGHTSAPPRTAVRLPEDGTLLLMPAVDQRLAITKLVSVHPRNAARELPSVHGEVIVMDARTGERLFTLDGGVVTARRTAALSLLAAQILAPNLDEPLLIIGAGVQARAHLEAFTTHTPVRKIFVASRTKAHTNALVAHAHTLGVNAQAVDAPADVLDQTTLIITATTSITPVLPSNVRPDAFVAAVGAYRPDMAELPPELVQKARLYVDTLEGAQHEAGDFLQAGVDWHSVMPLQAALDAPRGADGPIIFKSVGHALWDLAAVRVAYAQLSNHP